MLRSEEGHFGLKIGVPEMARPMHQDCPHCALFHWVVIVQAVHAALDLLMTGRTVVVVAHRLSTIRNADSIVVFSSGAVVEQGTHNHLLAAAGPYADLVSCQM
jgi:ABC-type histidine transport system ATPase subunit